MANNTENGPTKESLDNILDDIDAKIIDARSDLNRKERLKYIFLSFLLLSCFILLLSQFDKTKFNIFFILLAWIVAPFSLFAYIGTDTEKINADIERLQLTKRIQLGIPDDESKDYFERLVKINIENLAAYYLLVKTHTSQSFKVLVGVSVAGLLLIMVGLIIGYNKSENIIAYISTGSGLIVEFISGIFFYLYNVSIIQLKNYHDSLIDVQNLLLSFKLVEKSTDEEAKTKIMSKIIDYLIQTKSGNSIKN